MTTPERLILPKFDLPPSVNHAYWDQPFIKGKTLPRGGIQNYAQLLRHVGCRKVLTDNAERYKQQAIAMLDESGYTVRIRDFVNSHVCVDITFYVHRSKWLTKDGLPNLNAGDVDNRIKILQDAIFQAAGINDAHAFFSGCRKVCRDGDYVVPILQATPEILDEF